MSKSNGFIILGNTGVGKSFLGNLILGEDIFVHECSPSSVTHKTEFAEFAEGSTRFAIFNIPGLIEEDQEAIERNKVEIHKAFSERPNSIVAFVFNGGVSGRILEEDIIAFQAIAKAYSFKPESLLLIVNDLPPTRPSNYEGATTVKLQSLLGFQNLDVCFLDRIETNNQSQRRTVRQKLLSAVTQRISKLHQKQGDIQLRADELRRLRTEWKAKQNQLESTIRNLQDQVSAAQRRYDDLERRMQNTRQTRRPSPPAYHAPRSIYVPVPLYYSPPPASAWGNMPLLPTSHPDSSAQVNRIMDRLRNGN